MWVSTLLIGLTIDTKFPSPYTAYDDSICLLLPVYLLIVDCWLNKAPS
jgi:hypothetical protein